MPTIEAAQRLYRHQQLATTNADGIGGADRTQPTDPADRYGSLRTAVWGDTINPLRDIASIRIE